MSTSDDFRTEEHDELDPELAELLGDAFRRDVSMEVAARHLWSIDRAARQAQEQTKGGTSASPDVVAAPSGTPVATPRAPRVTSPRARHRSRRALVAVLAAVMLFSTSTAALAASSESLPGDLLYSVKTTGEQARWLLAFTSEARALVLVEIAENRLAEADRARSVRPAVVGELIARAEDAIAEAERVPSARVAEAVQGVRTRDVATVAAGPDDLAPRAAPDRQPAPVDARRPATDPASPPTTQSATGAAPAASPSPAPGGGGGLPAALPTPVPSPTPTAPAGPPAPGAGPVPTRPPESSTVGAAGDGGAALAESVVPSEEPRGVPEPASRPAPTVPPTSSGLQGTDGTPPPEHGPPSRPSSVPRGLRPGTAAGPAAPPTATPGATTPAAASEGQGTLEVREGSGLPIAARAAAAARRSDGAGPLSAR